MRSVFSACGNCFEREYRYGLVMAVRVRGRQQNEYEIVVPEFQKRAKFLPDPFNIPGLERVGRAQSGSGILLIEEIAVPDAQYATRAHEFFASNRPQ